MKKFGLALGLIVFAAFSPTAFADDFSCAQYLNQVSQSSHSLDYELNYHLDRVGRLKTPFSTDAAIIGGISGLVFGTISHNPEVIAGLTAGGATAGHFVGKLLDKHYAGKVQEEAARTNQELSCLLKAKADHTSLSFSNSVDRSVSDVASGKTLPSHEQAESAQAISSASQAK